MSVPHAFLRTLVVVAVVTLGAVACIEPTRVVVTVDVGESDTSDPDVVTHDVSEPDTDDAVEPLDIVDTSEPSDLADLADLADPQDTLDVITPDVIAPPDSTEGGLSLVRESPEVTSFFVAKPVRSPLVVRASKPGDEVAGLSFRVDVLRPGETTWLNLTTIEAQSNGLLSYSGGITEGTSSNPSTVRFVSVDDPEVFVTFELRPVVLKTLALGPTHGCALSTDGELFCWGRNGPQAAFSGASRPMTSAPGVGPGLSPKLIPTPGPVSALSVGGQPWVSGNSGEPYATTCIVVESGPDAGNYCTGNGERGGLGNGGRLNASDWQRVVIDDGNSTPLPLARLLAGGAAFNCAVVNGGSQVGDEVWCWGDNTVGQIAPDGSSGANVFPAARRITGIRLEGGPSVITGISAGGNHACVEQRLDTGAGEATARYATRCWGANGSRQLGQVAAAPELLMPSGFPSPLPPLCNAFASKAELVALRRSESMPAPGGFHTCAAFALVGMTVSERESFSTACPADLMTSYVICAGSNAAGQLARSTSEQAADYAIGPDGDFVTGVRSLASGSAFTCASDDMRVRCWGSNAQGQLGRQVGESGAHGEVVTVTLPPITMSQTQVERFVYSVAAAGTYACALTAPSAAMRAATEVVCWGGISEGASGPVPSCDDNLPLGDPACWHVPRVLVFQ